MTGASSFSRAWPRTFFSYDSEVSGDGRFVVFGSGANNLVSGDTNGFDDAMLRDRDPTDFTSFCFPGVSGVASCPCANPPGVVGLGCNNSASTGGALLSAAGATYLTADTLVFTTNGQLATATSIVLQGSVQIPAGAVFGQGVRCVGGALKRLYVKTASGGSITAPNTGAGDLSVSARSALLGDPIPPGQSRYYLVYYRDPMVPGGCPTASTFNATPSGAVSWWPGSISEEDILRQARVEDGEGPFFPEEHEWRKRISRTSARCADRPR